MKTFVLSKLPSFFFIIWDCIKDFFRVLKPCRFSALTVAVVTVFLIFVQQGQESLRGLVESGSFLQNFRELFVFTVATVLWALSTWYSARKMLLVVFANTPPDTPRIIFFKEWIPRSLGTLAILSVALALALSSKAYDQISIKAEHGLKILALLQLAIAIIFSITAWKRRNIFGMIPVSKEKTVATFSGFVKSGKKVMLLFSLLTLVSFIVFTASPIRAGQNLGAVTILLLAAATWIPIGSTLVYWGSRYQFPVMSCLLLLAIIFSAINDNHTIRFIEDNTYHLQNISVNSQAERWFNPDISPMPREGTPTPFPG